MILQKPPTSHHVQVQLSLDGLSAALCQNQQATSNVLLLDWA